MNGKTDEPTQSHNFLHCIAGNKMILTKSQWTEASIKTRLYLPQCSCLLYTADAEWCAAWPAGSWHQLTVPCSPHKHYTHMHYSLPNYKCGKCGSLAEWLGRWTCDQQVAGSNPSLSTVECNPGQVVNTHVPLLPSSIIWYQPIGGDALRLGSRRSGVALATCHRH